MLGVRRRLVLAGAACSQPSLAHLAADVNAVFRELPVDPWSPVATAIARVDDPNELHQLRVATFVSGRLLMLQS